MRLQVKFASPGFFVNDPRLVVTLDERTLYDGSFRSGFEVGLDVAPGRHVLETAIHLTPSMARRRRFDLPLDADDGYRDVRVVQATLEYIRLTGNFKKRVSLAARA